MVVQLKLRQVASSHHLTDFDGLTAALDQVDAFQGFRCEATLEKTCKVQPPVTKLNTTSSSFECLCLVVIACQESSVGLSSYCVQDIQTWHQYHFPHDLLLLTSTRSRHSSPGFTKPVQPGSGLDQYKTGPNSKFKFKFKKMKISQKILKNTSRCNESNGVKFSQKFVHLVQFAGI